MTAASEPSRRTRRVTGPPVSSEREDSGQAGSAQGLDILVARQIGQRAVGEQQHLLVAEHEDAERQAIEDEGLAGQVDQRALGRAVVPAQTFPRPRLPPRWWLGRSPGRLGYGSVRRNYSATHALPPRPRACRTGARRAPAPPAPAAPQLAERHRRRGQPGPPPLVRRLIRAQAPGRLQMRLAATIAADDAPGGRRDPGLVIGEVDQRRDDIGFRRRLLLGATSGSAPISGATAATGSGSASPHRLYGADDLVGGLGRRAGEMFVAGGQRR